MDFKSLHVQSVACPRMRTLVLQTMDFQSIVVDYSFYIFLHPQGMPQSGKLQVVQISANKIPPFDSG